MKLASFAALLGATSLVDSARAWRMGVRARPTVTPAFSSPPAIASRDVREARFSPREARWTLRSAWTSSTRRRRSADVVSVYRYRRATGRARGTCGRRHVRVRRVMARGRSRLVMNPLSELSLLASIRDGFVPGKRSRDAAEAKRLFFWAKITLNPMRSSHEIMRVRLERTVNLVSGAGRALAACIATPDPTREGASSFAVPNNHDTSLRRASIPRARGDRGGSLDRG